MGGRPHIRVGASALNQEDRFSPGEDEDAMIGAPENTDTPPARMPLGFLILSVPVITANAALTVRLVWEETALTWREGPQMVGFALIHGRWALLVFSPFLALALGAWGVVEIVRARRARIRQSRGVIGALGTCALILAVMFTPYGFWQRLFVGRLAAGPYAGEFVTEAAAFGDKRTVTAFFEHGVPVDVMGNYGTPLHAAAVDDQPGMIEYLLAHGASINAIDPEGDSPLENAISSNSEAAARVLQAHGALRIKGTQAHRDSVIDAQVDSDIAKLHLPGSSH